MLHKNIFITAEKWQATLQEAAPRRGALPPQRLRSQWGLHSDKQESRPLENQKIIKSCAQFVNLLTCTSCRYGNGKITCGGGGKKNPLLHSWKTKPQQPVNLRISWQKSFLFLYDGKRLQPPAPMVSISQTHTHTSTHTHTLTQSAQDNLMHDSMALKVGWINWKWLKMQNWQGNR